MKWNKRIIVVAFLTLLLAGLIIYSRNFETFLYKYFQTKSTQGSRTLLKVYFLEHVQIVLLSSLVATVLGLVLGIFVTTSYGKDFKELLLKTVSLGQAFPSPALLALTVPVLGYGLKGALIALIVYALMPIVYNVVVGIEQVPEDIIDAAKGMGMTETEIYIKIKLPLALKVILGGLRTALVINISTATLAAAVGAGG